MHELPEPPDPAAVERTAAIVIAGHRGDFAAAQSAVADPAAIVRQAALGAIVRIDPDAAIETITQALNDPASTVRCRAVELSVAVGIDPSSALDDDEASVVEVAAFACGEHDWVELERPAPIERLCELATGHPDSLCREAAAAALGAIGDPRGLDAVLAACTDRVTVRRRAVLALAAFDDDRADAALRTALDDKDWQVRQAAEDLLEVGRSLASVEDPDAYAD